MKVPSIQERHAFRQRELFVGRDLQLSKFEDQLSLELNDADRKFIFHLYGQGGMGKSWILNRLLDRAVELGCITGRCETAVKSPLDLMKMMAETVPDKTYFDRFLASLHEYHEKREELESDPNTSAELKAAVARLATTSIVGLAAGGAEVFSGATFASQAGEIAAVLSTKFQSRDDVALLQDPIGVLTPMFLESLNQTCELTELPVVLIVDRYDKSSEFLDDWFSRVIRGELGETPGNVVICTAGRHRLDNATWASFLGVMLQLEVGPMSREDLCTLAAKCGVENKELAMRIAGAASGIPLVAASMAFSCVNSGQSFDPVDATTVAVDSILGDTPSDRHRTLALEMAVARKVQHEIVRAVVPDASSESIDWLFDAPFIQPAGDSWEFHDAVREQFVNFLKSDSPERLKAIHARLADHWTGGKDFRELPGVSTVEYVYHSFASGNTDSAARIVSHYFEHDLWSRHEGTDWAASIAQAEYEMDVPFESSVGAHLLTHLATSNENDNYANARAISGTCFDDLELSVDARASLQVLRAQASASAQLYGKAFEFVEQALALKETFDAHVTHAELFRLGQQIDESVSALDRASEFADSKSERTFVWRLRSSVELARGNATTALEHARQAVSIDRANASALICRGQALRANDEFTAAFRDFKRAMRITQYATHDAREEIAQTHARRDEHKLAVSNAAKGLAEDPYCPVCLSIVAESSVQLEGLEAAVERLEEFEVAAELKGRFTRSWLIALSTIYAWEEVLRVADLWLTDHPNDKRVLAYRGLAQDETGDSELAVETLLDSLGNHDVQTHALSWLAEAYVNLDAYDDALEVLEDLGEFGGSWETSARFLEALVLSYLGKWADAIAIYKTLPMEGDSTASLSYNIAVATIRLHGTAESERSDALAALEKARPVRAHYGQAGLAALGGDLDGAIPLLEKALRDGGFLVCRWLLRDPAFEFARSDQRIVQLIRSYSDAYPQNF